MRAAYSSPQTCPAKKIGEISALCRSRNRSEAVRRGSASASSLRRVHGRGYSSLTTRGKSDGAYHSSSGNRSSNGSSSPWLIRTRS
ncbi:hypothetical protein [Catenulispora rubra]|uniref:hypothetical protein n=1 Tax=Catenulispora rubra TaxID=280293 RepID=UPI00189245A1|nr:hypothetical protein [Catenulispora rubra]